MREEAEKNRFRSGKKRSSWTNLLFVNVEESSAVRRGWVLQRN